MYVLLFGATLLSKKGGFVPLAHPPLPKSSQDCVKLNKDEYWII